MSRAFHAWSPALSTSSTLLGFVALGISLVLLGAVVIPEAAPRSHCRVFWGAQLPLDLLCFLYFIEDPFQRKWALIFLLKHIFKSHNSGEDERKKWEWKLTTASHPGFLLA